MPTLELTLASVAAAAHEAREALRELEPHLGPTLLSDVMLLSTELVTNSVRHGHLGADSWVRLSVSVEPDLVRVEVTDPGVGFRPVPFGPAHDGSSGWGLFLVARLATRWGIERTPTRVWFEVYRSATPASSTEGSSLAGADVQKRP